MSWRTWAVCGALYVMLVTSGAMAAAPSAPSTSSITLLELFTSEGCSSCPPADALLFDLEERAAVPQSDLLVLAYHVDYWNSLGWRDRWSDATFSERQRAYGARFGSNRIYTPQLIVNGRVEFVGSDRGRVEREIKHASAIVPLPVAVRPIDDATIEVRVAPSAAQGDLYLVLAERGLSSKVARGENAGKLLRHPSVVRTLHRSTAEERAAGSARLDLPRDLDRAAARVVAFVQEPDEGAIVAAGWAPLVAAP